MVRFFEIQVLIVKKPSTTHYPKQHLFVKTKPEGEGAPASEKPSLSHFHYGITIELGAPGQLVTSLDSFGSVRLQTRTRTLLWECGT